MRESQESIRVYTAIATGIITIQTETSDDAIYAAADRILDEHIAAFRALAQ